MGRPTKKTLHRLPLLQALLVAAALVLGTLTAALVLSKAITTRTKGSSQSSSSNNNNNRNNNSYEDFSLEGFSVQEEPATPATTHLTEADVNFRNNEAATESDASFVPSMTPTEFPSEVPSGIPSASDVLSEAPSEIPAGIPSTDVLSEPPSDLPSDIPSADTEESDEPSAIPSTTPVPSTSITDREASSDAPSFVPSDVPSDFPSEQPSDLPSHVPSSSSPPPVIPRPPLVHGIQPDCNTNDPTRFNICLDVRSDSGQVEDWFDALRNATVRWERILAADPRPEGWDASVMNRLADQFVATARPTDALDDVYVAVVLTDSLNDRFLAVANPTLFQYNRNTQQWQVAAGRIQLNRARFREHGLSFLETLLFRSIGQILGIGLLWRNYNLVQGSRYVGPNALRAWRDLGCSGPLPVSGFHWDWKCLLHEVNNPTFTPNQRQLFSPISMGTLQDLGYQVNANEADPFGLNDLVASACTEFCREATGQRRLGQQSPSPPLGRASDQRIRVAVTRNIGEPLFASLDPETDALVSAGRIPPPPRAVVVTFEENGQYHSQIIHHHEAEILP